MDRFRSEKIFMRREDKREKKVVTLKRRERKRTLQVHTYKLLICPLIPFIFYSFEVWKNWETPFKVMNDGKREIW